MSRGEEVPVIGKNVYVFKVYQMQRNYISHILLCTSIFVVNAVHSISGFK